MIIKSWRCLILISCTLLLGAGDMKVVARSRTTAFLKFEIKVVDSITRKPKSNFILGETVTAVFTLTNQSRHAHTISDLQDTYIPYTLVSRFENKETEIFESYRGGTGGSYVGSNGIVLWMVREPRKITLAPGQSVSVTIPDLRCMYAYRLDDGYHTLTATYPGRLQSKVSFRIVIDQAKTIPLLEKLAATPASSKPDRLWATSYLDEIRHPSLSGIVTDTSGKPLAEVDISVTGREKREYETRENGGYYVGQLSKGGTYTVTPSLHRDGYFDADFTFDPPSRTITNLNSKLTNLNFKATRVRSSINVADESEGATARASSTLSTPNDKHEVSTVIDGVNKGKWDQCCNAAWSDATPNTYPDWVEVKFKDPIGIDWINVYTLQDQPEPRHDPTLNETFTKDGITDFDVQYWSGRAWKTVPGGAIRGNRNVWRKIAFPTITTNKIRVVVRKALAGYSRIMEIEAFHINQDPVVKLTGSSKAIARSWTQFKADISDWDGSISKYTLDPGDGSPKYEQEFGNKPAIKKLNFAHPHMYFTAGTYTVTLRVMDHDDEGTERTMIVRVTDPDQPLTSQKHRRN